MKFSDSEKTSRRAGGALISPDGIKGVGTQDFRNGDHHVNGNGLLVNGHHATDIVTTSPQGNRKEPFMADESLQQIPPEIVHISSGYVSLSVVIERLVQETFNDLGNVISRMAEISAEQQRPNGVSNHVHHQANGIVSGKSETDVQKKLLMLNFTQNWRSKFIKVMVLSQWARQAEAVSRVIDLKNWQDMERLEYDGAVTAMGELKRGLAAMKEPSPDMKTALEVLLLGKASWLPDFDYLSPKQLTTQQLLDAFRRINTVLSIRLNLHETIPTILRDFSISSGRATFRVPEEFEVDLSVAEEDPSSQLFFVDFRLNFFPSAAPLPPGVLRSELEERANATLKREGLRGLFDLLHDLVLTHKLNILKSQAYDMMQTYWSEHLVVEPVRRSIVVQYWSNRPGRKNWVEIGVRRGEERRSTITEKPDRISSIGMRCFRAGSEVHDVKVDMRLGNLSMEYIMRQIIAQHSSSMYDGITSKLVKELLFASGCLKISNRVSNEEPADASLLVQLAPKTAIKVVQEPVSGRFAVQPASKLNRRAEYELNRLESPIKDAPSQLAYLRSLVSVEEVEASAREIGWDMPKSINPSKEEILRHFPKGTLQTRFFRRHQWDSRWTVAFTTSLEGDSWWVVELVKSRSSTQETAPPGSSKHFQAAYNVCYGKNPPLVFPSSSRTLTQVEWTAVGMISQYNDAREMANDLRHSILVPSTGALSFTMSIHIPRSRLSFAERRPVPQPGQKDINITEPQETVKLLYKGIDAATRSAVHIVIARVSKPISRLRDIFSNIPNLAIASLPVGTTALGNSPSAIEDVEVFRFMLTSKVGESCIPNLIRRLVSIERLLDCVSILETNNLVINSASLSRIKFTYAAIPKALQATIDLLADNPLRLSFPSRSPHIRIRDFLTLVVSRAGLASLVALLRMTLPILNAFSAIEKSHSSNDVNIIARSEQWFEVRYSAPLPRGGFNIILRLRRDEPYWFINEASIKVPEPLRNEDAWSQSLKTVTRGKGKGWRGMKGGIIADLTDGIEDALQKLDEVFRNATQIVPGDANPSKRKAESQIVEID